LLEPGRNTFPNVFAGSNTDPNANAFANFDANLNSNRYPGTRSHGDCTNRGASRDSSTRN
jgi:hypothetical protein